MIAYKSRPSCFREMWALCVLWITYDHLDYAPCSACWAVFASLVPAMCNCTWYAQVHELPQSFCGDNREGTLFSWLHIYHAPLALGSLKRDSNTGVFLWILWYYYEYLQTTDSKKIYQLKRVSVSALQRLPIHVKSKHSQ